MPRSQKNYRFSTTTLNRLSHLVDKLGVSETAVVERAVAMLFEELKPRSWIEQTAEGLTVWAKDFSMAHPQRFMVLPQALLDSFPAELKLALREGQAGAAEVFLYTLLNYGRVADGQGLWINTELKERLFPLACQYDLGFTQGDD